jgi:hypothetical protein
MPRDIVYVIARSPRVVAALCVALAVCPLASCVTEGETRRTQRPKPPPSDVRASALTLVAEGAFEDTDANGLRDSLSVIAYLFAPETGYALAISQPGSFSFRLLDAERQPVAEWTFTPEETAAVLSPSLAPGPGYLFRLDLRTIGREQLEAPEVWLSATFTPSEGRPVHRLGSAAIIAGPTR